VGRVREDRARLVRVVADRDHVVEALIDVRVEGLRRLTRDVDAELVLGLEQEFQIKVEDEEVGVKAFASVNALCDFIEQKKTA